MEPRVSASMPDCLLPSFRRMPVKGARLNAVRSRHIHFTERRSGLRCRTSYRMPFLSSFRRMPESILLRVPIIITAGFPGGSVGLLPLTDTTTPVINGQT